MYGTKVANGVTYDDISTVDTGTCERGNHRGGIRLASRTVTEGGISTSIGAQARHECALDVLLGDEPLEGLLAGSEGSLLDRRAIARSRYEAGMRLRRLFMKAGLQPVKAFNPDGRGGGDDLSDTQAQARTVYNSIMRKLGPWGEMAAGPCCYDQLNAESPRWIANIKRALDVLCERNG